MISDLQFPEICQQFRKSRSDTERPVRVDVDPETIWALIEAASHSGISLRQALRLKKTMH